MAELADAHGSGPCEGNFMQVQVLLSAPKKEDRPWGRASFLISMGRIDPVERVGVSQQRNGNVRNINHPLCGCATIVIQKITFPL